MGYKYAFNVASIALYWLTVITSRFSTIDLRQPTSVCGVAIDDIICHVCVNAYIVEWYGAILILKIFKS